MKYLNLKTISNCFLVLLLLGSFLFVVIKRFDIENLRGITDILGYLNLTCSLLWMLFYLLDQKNKPEEPEPDNIIPENSPSWNTWFPFQSKEEKNRYAHMTKSEKNEMTKRAMLYGFWCAFTFAIPIGIITTPASSLSFGIVVSLIVLHVICIPFWLKKQRGFLNSTEWSQLQEFSDEQLRLSALKKG